MLDSLGKYALSDKFLEARFRAGLRSRTVCASNVKEPESGRYRPTIWDGALFYAQLLDESFR